IVRNGKPMTLSLKLGELPANAEQGPGGTGKAPSQGALRGISVQNLTAGIRSQLNLPSGETGVVITGVDPNSPAGQAGLGQGDVIESINRQAVNSVADFNRLAASASGETLLRVIHHGYPMFIVISPSGGQ
ncbi:MAG: PDZ domain-containing protein, partial [Terriglobia bacterium]